MAEFCVSIISLRCNDDCSVRVLSRPYRHFHSNMHFIGTRGV